jgi:hypothetical protein
VVVDIGEAVRAGLLLEGQERRGTLRTLHQQPSPLEKDIGDEVRAWVEENWGRWKEERPPWFKAEMVPERVVPAVEQEARKSLIGGGGV